MGNQPQTIVVTPGSNSLPPQQSPRFSMSSSDVKRVFIHLGLVGVAAILSEVFKMTNTINLGPNQSFLVPVISVIEKAILVFVQGNLVQSS